MSSGQYERVLFPDRYSKHSAVVVFGARGAEAASGYRINRPMSGGRENAISKPGTRLGTTPSADAGSPTSAVLILGLGIAPTQRSLVSPTQPF
jgi:hypothetical protein